MSAYISYNLLRHVTAIDGVVRIQKILELLMNEPVSVAVLAYKDVPAVKALKLWCRDGC